MINALLESLWLFTLLSAALLLCHRWVLRFGGATSAYALWLLLPLALLVNQLPLPLLLSHTLPPLAMETLVTLPHALAAHATPWATILLSLWGSTSACGLVFWLWQERRFQRRLAITPIAASTLPLALPAALRVYQSNHAHSPMLMGWFSPQLVLPTSFSQRYSKRQQRLILEHELCHLHRGDLHWNRLAACCLAATWFHPLSWLAFARFRRDQELSCDQTVLARKHKECRVNYGKALLQTAATVSSSPFAPLSFKKYGDKPMMFERLTQIKSNAQGSKRGKALIAAAALMLLSGISYAGNDHTTKAVKNATMVAPLTRIAPQYPAAAAAQGVEGSVILKFDVQADGRVSNISVVRAIPNAVFVHEAKKALAQWTYKTSANGIKDALVQLDFALEKRSDSPYPQVEQIQIINHNK
ncbi:M56 family metallopeptidase [uncultured Ferrimonas sp.]|uniref:M56 family metallopeptidase n=1 Tax=uncultured Ferrimonas sp. TaxID=432640 RepID=UPI002633F707|nr:M56 family metallopeptidase [uncultured Ferrimonas sp.]